MNLLEVYQLMELIDQFDHHTNLELWESFLLMQLITMASR